MAITVAKLRPQVRPLRCKMNEATALPPTTEGVKADANSHKRMLEVARFAFSSPLAKTLNRTTYPASLKTTHSNATPTHLQSTVIAANCAQEAPCQEDHPTMPTEPSTAAVTATQILCGVSHVWAF